MAEEKNKVTRNIYYYDLYPIIRENSSVTEEKEAYVKTFSKMEEIYNKFLKAKKEGKEKEADSLLNDMHFLTEKGDYLYVLVDGIDEYVIKFRIVRCRTNALPYINIDGKLEKITKKIEGKFDVAEVTHCVIFAERNIMGAEYNSAGARATSIAVLIDERNYELERLKVLNKINENALSKLRSSRKYNLFELCIKNSPEIIEQLRNKHLIGAFFQDYEFDTYTIRIKRRITKNKDGFIPPFGIDEMQELIANNGDQITRFVVDQGLYSKEVNLLSDKMMVQREFEYDKDERVLDSNKVYNSIINNLQIS